MGIAESPKDISGLGLDELKALLVQALEENARLKAENAELREEIARLNEPPTWLLLIHPDRFADFGMSQPERCYTYTG